MKPFKYIFLSVFILSTLILTAQTIYVDASNNTGVEDGTADHPFNTIKEGINAAVPEATVMIMDGTYIPDDSWSGNDHTLILKAGVKLVGESPENTLIDGIVVDQEVSNLSISLENLSFDEFHFGRGTVAGPFTEQNVVRNCHTALISTPFGAGIPVNDSTPGPNYGLLIENNDLGTDGIIEFTNGAGVSEMNVINNTCGYIYLKCGGGYTFLIDNNDVQYGIVDASGACITTISDNRIYDGAIIDRSGGNQYGIEDQIIENNIIQCYEDSPILEDEYYKACISASSRSVTIRNNTITGTGKVSGIHGNAGAPFHVVDNNINLDEVPVPGSIPEEVTYGLLNTSGWGYVTGNKIAGGQIGYYSQAGTVEIAYNEIRKAFTGFHSGGNEVVHHNKIEQCYGDGLILHGLKGPVHDNVIINNAGSGILIIYPNIDLGGGEDNCPGNNIIQGNGNFDLYIQSQNALNPTLYARYNVWDHTNPADISLYDIRDASDSAGLVAVDFTPWGYLGVKEHGGMEACGQGGLFLWPNPAQELIHGRFNMDDGRFNKDLTWVIYDVFGREVAANIISSPLVGGGREGGWTIDISFLSPGMYIVFCKDMENRLSSGKFIKSLE